MYRYGIHRVDRPTRYWHRTVRILRQLDHWWPLASTSSIPSTRCNSWHHGSAPSRGFMHRSAIAAQPRKLPKAALLSGQRRCGPGRGSSHRGIILHGISLWVGTSHHSWRILFNVQRPDPLLQNPPWNFSVHSATSHVTQVLWAWLKKEYRNSIPNPSNKLEKKRGFSCKVTLSPKFSGQKILKLSDVQAQNHRMSDDSSIFV